MADPRIIQEILREETKKRLIIMESPTYEFPDALSTEDKMIILAGIIVSLLILTACMTGGLGE